MIFDSIVDKRFSVSQLMDEGQYLVSAVGRDDDDAVAGLMEDMKDISSSFDRLKFDVRRKLVDIKQTFETTAVEVACLTLLHALNPLAPTVTIWEHL